MFRRILSAIAWLLLTPFRAALWIYRQASATVSNTVSFFRNLNPYNLLPPSFRDLLNWLGSQIPKALGKGTPRQQVTASVTIAIVMVVASIGFLTPAALLLLIPFSIGFLRMVPAINDQWSRISGSSRSTGKPLFRQK